MQINGTTIEIVVGDITLQATDAIVNAANPSLVGWGGVSGAILRAGGPELVAACEALGGCETGAAVATAGYRLPARQVFHAVGPVYSGRAEDAELLRSAYDAVFALAAEHGSESLALCAISTGIYGYPLEAATAIAVAATIDNVRRSERLRLVRFVTWPPEIAAVYREALAAHSEE